MSAQAKCLCKFLLRVGLGASCAIECFFWRQTQVARGRELAGIATGWRSGSQFACEMVPNSPEAAASLQQGVAPGAESRAALQTRVRFPI